MPRDELLALSARLAQLIEELTAIKAAALDIQTTLPAPAAPSGSLQQKLLTLFTQPVTGATSRALVPYQEVSPGIRIGLDPDGRLELTVAPKRVYNASPEACLNTLYLLLGGRGWFSLAVSLAASEVANARRYQFGLSAQASRPLTCRLVLRQPLREGHKDTSLDQFSMHPDQRSYNLSGELAQPIEAAAADRVMFIVIFEADSRLDFALNYLNLYFA